MKNCNVLIVDDDEITLQLLQLIRRKYKDIPVLMLTDNATRDLVIAAQKNGVSDFVAKPFKNYDLTE